MKAAENITFYLHIYGDSLTVEHEDNFNHFHREIMFVTK